MLKIHQVHFYVFHLDYSNLLEIDNTCSLFTPVFGFKGSPRLVYKSSSNFLDECKARVVDFLMFSVAKASKRAKAQLVSPAKNSIK